MRNFLLACCGFVLYSCSELQPVTVGNVENPQVKKFSQQGIEAEFRMKIGNPNKMKITVYPSEFDGVLNGINIGKIKLDKRVKIKANSDESETFHIKSDFSNLELSDMAGIAAMAVSKNITVALNGNVKAGKWYYKKKFPVALKKTISLSR